MAKLVVNHVSLSLLRFPVPHTRSTQTCRRSAENSRLVQIILLARHMLCGADESCLFGSKHSGRLEVHRHVTHGARRSMNAVRVARVLAPLPDAKRPSHNSPSRNLQSDARCFSVASCAKTLTISNLEKLVGGRAGSKARWKSGGQRNQRRKRATSGS